MLVLVALVVILVFTVWHRRKVTKDKRQDRFVERLGQALGSGASTDIAQGNTLLRQLSLKPRGGVSYDNPTFQLSQAADAVSYSPFSLPSAVGPCPS